MAVYNLTVLFMHNIQCVSSYFISDTEKARLEFVMPRPTDGLCLYGNYATI